MISICEVGPRDGLQNEKSIVSTDVKIELIKKLIDSGINKIEVTSFVNKKIVPQMADAEDILQGLPYTNDIEYAGLVLSQSGLERALQTKVHTLHITMATSETFNQKNVRRSINQSLDELTQVIHSAKRTNKKFVAVLGTAFGCPYEGEVKEGHIFRIAEKFLESGCDAVTLADTTGEADPQQVSQTVTNYYKQFGSGAKLGLHLHNTRGLGLANAYSGYQAGVRIFDSSIAGIGGCPFAPKAVGNVCTEDLVHMFHRIGIESTIDIPTLVESARWLENQIGRKLDGMIMKL